MHWFLEQFSPVYFSCQNDRLAYSISCFSCTDCCITTILDRSDTGYILVPFRFFEMFSLYVNDYFSLLPVDKIVTTTIPTAISESLI